MGCEVELLTFSQYSFPHIKYLEQQRALTLSGLILKKQRYDCTKKP